MTMSNNGLTKLIEECGELTQICAKKIAFMDTDIHPDGKGSMKERLEEEIADVMAACAFVVETLELDEDKVGNRALMKFDRFKAWHEDKAA